MATHAALVLYDYVPVDERAARVRDCLAGRRHELATGASVRLSVSVRGIVRRGGSASVRWHERAAVRWGRGGVGSQRSRRRRGDHGGGRKGRDSGGGQGGGGAGGGGQGGGVGVGVRAEVSPGEVARAEVVEAAPAEVVTAPRAREPAPPRNLIMTTACAVGVRGGAWAVGMRGGLGRAIRRIQGF